MSTYLKREPLRGEDRLDFWFTPPSDLFPEFLVTLSAIFPLTVIVPAAFTTSGCLARKIQNTGCCVIVWCTSSCLATLAWWPPGSTVEQERLLYKAAVVTTQVTVRILSVGDRVRTACQLPASLAKRQQRAQRPLIFAMYNKPPESSEGLLLIGIRCLIRSPYPPFSWPVPWVWRPFSRIRTRLFHPGRPDRRRTCGGCGWRRIP